MSRIGGLLVLGWFLCGLRPGPGVTAQEAASSERVAVSRQSARWAEVGRAMERGLAFLKSEQQTGGIGTTYPVAVTSLAGMAILGAGYLPGQEPYGTMLEGGLKYLKSVADPVSGYITESGKSQSRMHGHCYAVLFLTQLLGSLSAEEETEVVSLVRLGLKTIHRAQSREGGWYYGPENKNNEDEASVTVCALQALRAARNVGFAVDALTIKTATDYVRRCQAEDGSFRYRLRGDPRTTFALSVAALSTLNAAGVYESSELRKGLDYVHGVLGRHTRRPWHAVEEEYPYYGNLYAAQTFHQGRSPQWEHWYAGVSDYLLKKQQSDGRWESRNGDAYATAMALLILEVPRGYLPVFER